MLNNKVNSELTKVLAAKERRRKALRELPIEEKVKIIVQMQKMLYPIIKDRNPKACVWKI